MGYTHAGPNDGYADGFGGDARWEPRICAMEPEATPEPLVLPAGVHHLCGCGRSSHGWFCDGAHLGTGGSPMSCGWRSPAPCCSAAAAAPAACPSVMAAMADGGRRWRRAEGW